MDHAALLEAETTAPSRRVVDVLVTASEFDLNAAAGSGGAVLASNLENSITIVDSGFDRNKAAGGQFENGVLQCVRVSWNIGRARGRSMIQQIGGLYAQLELIAFFTNVMIGV